MWLHDVAYWMAPSGMYKLPEQEDKQERLERAGAAALTTSVAVGVTVLATGGFGMFPLLIGTFVGAMTLRPPLDPATAAQQLENDRADAEYRRQDIIHEGP